jgi:hypothetical protein
MRIPLRFYSAGWVLACWLATIALAFTLGTLSSCGPISHAHAQQLPYCDEVRTTAPNGIQVLCALRDQGILLPPPPPPPPPDCMTCGSIANTPAPHCDDDYTLVLLLHGMQPMCAKDIKEPNK